MIDPPFTFVPGEGPLLISVPHAGVELPAGLARALSPAAAALPDTDWHVHHLMRFAQDLGAGLIVARASRMVIDLNRPDDDAPLYPGQAGTGLVPTELFDGRPAWSTPPAHRAAALEAVWRPYHAALAAELRRLRARHGHAVLWDAHSIRSRVPRLFDGALPTLNLGTNSGQSCAPSLRAALIEVLEASPFTAVADGRFKGGHITRRYGQPADGVHAVQLEIAQHAYLDEAAPAPPPWDPARAALLQATLAEAVGAALRWRP
jgi:N-formylglutamate deformylase